MLGIGLRLRGAMLPRPKCKPLSQIHAECGLRELSDSSNVQSSILFLGLVNFARWVIEEKRKNPNCRIGSFPEGTVGANEAPSIPGIS